LNHKLTPLVELQKYDLRMMEVHDLRRKIPDRLQVAEAPLREAAQLLNDTNLALDVLSKERRAHEKDLEVHEAQVDKMRLRLSELKTNKEYQAHLFEIELANKKRGDFEDKILISMEKIDQLQRTAKETQDKVKTLEAAFAQEKRVLDEQDRVLAAELAELQARYQRAAARVEKPLLERYTQIKAARKDQALAAVRGGICSGCRLQIPPQLIAQVKRSEDLHVCPYCRRMLYWEGEPGSEEASRALGLGTDLEMGESV
jgi:uncharacterized protein